MCGTAGVTRIITLTFKQPLAAVPGTVPAGDWLQPEEFAGCNPSTHVYLYKRDMTWRWRRLSACKSCCRWVSHKLKLFRLRMRYHWPEFQYLQVKEDHKTGALHLHLAVLGVPASITRSSAAGLKVKAAWAEVGGGWVDVGRHGRDSGDKAGWYVGKYVAKRHDTTMSPGFRRWSRTAEFAPEVLMRPRFLPDPESWHDPGAPIILGDWLHPDGTESGARWWPKTELLEAPPPRLDPITAKGRKLRSVLADIDAWRALHALRRGPEAVPSGCCALPVPEPVQGVMF
jgi:hypothetical protein